jgi:hypothetical protein
VTRKKAGGKDKTQQPAFFPKGGLLLVKVKSGNDLLSQGITPSTIGAGGLNGRVRDGNGCGPSAVVTGKLL